jgi:phosphate-selective porin OprO/OprP
VNFGWFKPAQLRIGQMHMPFGLEKLTSDLFTDFQERYIGDSMIPDKLRGMFVHGAPTTGLYYGLGISNGNGAKNANDANALADGKQAVGRISINIAQMLGDANAVYHLGTSFAHTTGTTTIQTPFAPNTESRGLAGFGASAFNGAPTERKISGLEGAIAYGPFKVQAEALKTSYSGTTTALVDYDRDIKAHYVTAAWLITGERYADAYANGVFGRIRPNSNFNGHSGTGAWEVAIRASEWDAGDFQTSNVTGTGQLTAGKTNKIKATTLGLKWIVNPNTRVILNYIESKYDTPVTITNATLDKEQAVTMRAQFDF